MTGVLIREVETTREEFLRRLAGATENRTTELRACFLHLEAYPAFLK